MSKINLPNGKKLTSQEFFEGLKDFPESCEGQRRCFALWSCIRGPLQQGLVMRGLPHKPRASQVAISMGKHSQFINFCPFCGKELQDVEE